MSEIIRFDNFDRRNFVYKVKMVLVNSYDGRPESYPCIVMYAKDTGIPAAYTDYGAYLIPLNEVSLLQPTSLKKRASNVCCFLNYVLLHTTVDTLADVDIDIIRAFLIDYQKNGKGENKRSETFFTCRRHVFDFLVNYHNAHKYVRFSFQPNELIQRHVVKIKGRKCVVNSSYNMLYVQRTVNAQRRCRILLPDYLQILIRAARMHDPILVLPIMLQAYAGLREGEVVNVSRDKIHIQENAFGRIKKITIDLNRNAAFFGSEYKSSPGRIKKPREQVVYFDFLEMTNDAWEFHKHLLEQYESERGIAPDPQGPILINRYGRPMSVTTYEDRLRRLFRDHFIDMLEREARANGTLDVDAEWIILYRKNYPGAHMLRHWFTMYLLTRASNGHGRPLTRAEIAKLRGDRNEQSMDTYVSNYGEVIDLYREAMVHYQEDILQ